MKVRSLKALVGDVLRDVPETRNSDVTLTIEVWKRTNAHKIHGEGTEAMVYVRDLYDLPREDNIKRVRAQYQNEMKLYLPTSLEVARARKINEAEWKIALDQPTHRVIELVVLPDGTRAVREKWI